MSAAKVETEEPRAGNVIEALARVIRDLPAIGKGGRADPKQGGYAYRGIEQITVAAQPLLAKHGVVFTPHRILDRETVDIVVNNKPWTDEKMTVLWRVYGPGGVTDFIEIETPAIGRDNSDKGANKCMTQAFKYALIPTLCISDSKDDGDGQTFERDTAPEMATVTQRQEILDRLTDLGKYPETWISEHLPDRKHMDTLTAASYELGITLLDAASIVGGGDDPLSEASGQTAADPSPAPDVIPAGESVEPETSGTDAAASAASAESPAPSEYELDPEQALTEPISPHLLAFSDAPFDPAVGE